MWEIRKNIFSLFKRKSIKLIIVLFLAEIYSLSFYKFHSFIPASFSLGLIVFIFSIKKGYECGFGFIAGSYAFLRLSSFIPGLLIEQISIPPGAAHLIHFISAGIVPGIFFELIIFLSFLIYGKRKDILYPSIALSSIFAIVELIRVSISYAGIWGHPSLFFTDYSITPYISRFAGKEGLSFIFFLISLLVSKSLQQFYNKNFKKGLVLSMIPLSIIAVFFIHFPVKEIKNRAKENFSIIHSGIPDSARWNKNNKFFHLTTYLSMSEKAVRNFKSTIILWPETSLWWDPLYDQETRRLMELFSQKNRSVIIFGAPSVNFNDENIKENKNSLFLLSQKGTMENIYDKKRLIPFLEKKIFKSAFFLNRDKFFYKEGKKKSVINLEFIKEKSIRAELLICYEINFLPKAQKREPLLPGIIIQFSNDSWFKNSHASEMELKILRLLSMERKLPAIRVTGFGIAAFIDENGRIIKKSGIDKNIILNSGVNISTKPKKTFYQRFPYIFTLVMVILVLGIISDFAPKKKSPDGVSTRA